MQTISQAEHFFASESCLVTDRSAEMLQTRANSGQRLNPHWEIQRDSFQQQPQKHPSPFNLQYSAGGTRPQPQYLTVLPEEMCTSCNHTDYCTLKTSPIPFVPNSIVGFDPNVIDTSSSPVDFWYEPPHSWGPQSEVHPSCCTTPQTVSVLQPRSSDLYGTPLTIFGALQLNPDCFIVCDARVSRREAQKVSIRMNMTLESAGAGTGKAKGQRSEFFCKKTQKP